MVTLCRDCVECAQLLEETWRDVLCCVDSCVSSKHLHKEMQSHICYTWENNYEVCRAILRRNSLHHCWEITARESAWRASPPLIKPCKAVRHRTTTIILLRDIKLSLFSRFWWNRLNLIFFSRLSGIYNIDETWYSWIFLENYFKLLLFNHRGDTNTNDLLCTLAKAYWGWVPANMMCAMGKDWHCRPIRAKQHFNFIGDDFLCGQ